ncbi:MAG: SigB/SigF/SigG family RNA polymerase sigma factor [Streptosporangiales bacterium]|nr:SigB/SigF/SigG family RNA polymerase sigma factor [Streptosporangiales bacterium]
MTSGPPSGADSDTDLFRALAAVGDDEERRERVYAILVERYDWLVRWAVNRYTGRGEQAEELAQVGYLGLVEAIQRFDVDRGVDFVTFARPTVLGEIRRHFRDGRRWVRLPRRLQELKMRIRDATEELTQTTGHLPTAAELATYLETSEEAVTEALAADDTFSPLSLDAPVGDDDEVATHLDAMGEDDTDLEDVVDSESLWPLLEKLPQREQEMVLLRYYGNMTQSDIADRLGISQMHVSRLLSQTLAALRRDLVTDDDLQKDGV